MFYFLYSIFDTLLEWVGLKTEEKSNGLNDLLRESIYSDIEYDKRYIESRKKRSKYNSIYDIYKILDKDYGLKLPMFGDSLNILSWFTETIDGFTEENNVEEKVKLLLLKVEYEKWSDITKREKHLSLKESLLDDSLTVDDYIEIMNEC